MFWAALVMAWVVVFIWLETSDTRNVSLLVKIIMSGVISLVLTLATMMVIKVLLWPTWVFLLLGVIVLVAYLLFRKSPAKTAK
ncbi:hypothetical protein HZB94_04505 [Candidatus Falkowbacteria bacterium]|nr:hypothetical protein [Candidatus Falkowbacteria bacterium]